MENIKKYKVLFVLAIVVIAGVFLFFNRTYHNDVKVLEDFLASYERFDKAISDRSLSEAEDALRGLNQKASSRISSLIKNDAELMSTALEIADISKKELDGLKAQNIDINDLTKNRKATYARFRELGGIKN